jgi:tRNA uridine 5-carboxymethylaminomethyl modification enzyme
LIDDLITLGTKEPYRLFTSRAEYRLLLREDNADLRLRDIGYKLGLVDTKTYEAFKVKREAIERSLEKLAATMIKPGPVTDSMLERLGSVPLRQTCSLKDLLRRPEITLEDLEPFAELDRELAPGIKREVQLQIKYQGYIDRQSEQVARFRKMESVGLPEDLTYDGLSGLSNEVIEKLTKVQPRSLGQASRISGITPAAISVLQIHLRKQGFI